MKLPVLITRGITIFPATELSLDIGRDMSAQWNSLISNISFHGKAKYATMSVADLEIALRDALANGGV